MGKTYYTLDQTIPNPTWLLTTSPGSQAYCLLLFMSDFTSPGGSRHGVGARPWELQGIHEDSGMVAEQMTIHV